MTLVLCDWQTYRKRILTLRRHIKGFTLLEILIVIGIIGILLAVLFPVLASSRDKARQSARISNMRQIGVAIATYAQDYDSLYPSACDPVDKNVEAWGGLSPDPDIVKELPLLTDVLVPYIKNNQLWRCPSDAGFPVNSPLFDDVVVLTPFACDSFFEKFGTSYVYRLDLATNHAQYPASAVDKDNGATYGSSEVNVLSETYGEWHTHPTGIDSERYNHLMADNHITTRSFFISTRFQDMVAK